MLPFFDSLIENRMGFALDEEGRYYLDRSGELFAVILQYLRTRKRPGEVLLKKHRCELQSECEFFGLECLAQEIRGETCPLHLRPADRRIRQDENLARENSIAFGDLLVDVFAADTKPLERDSLELPLLLQSADQPQLGGSFPDFYRRLNNFSGQLLDQIKDIPGIIIAGGAVIGALTSCPAGDIDIFLSMPTETAEKTLTLILEAVQRNQTQISKKRLMVTRSKNAITFFRVAGDKLARPPVQVRLR